MRVVIAHALFKPFDRRSQIVRLLYGGRVSLMVGFVAALVNLTVGVAVGVTAGYMRGRVDDLFTWFVTTWPMRPARSVSPGSTTR